MIRSHGGRWFPTATACILRRGGWATAPSGGESAKLYRAYYQDYRVFLSRPEVVAESIPAARGERVYVVHADLRQFYDRVRPNTLAEAIDRVRRDSDESRVLLFGGVRARLGLASARRRKMSGSTQRRRSWRTSRGWRCHRASSLPASSRTSCSSRSTRHCVRRSGPRLLPSILLADSCRYVDDLRILVALSIELGWLVERTLRRSRVQMA